MRSQRRSAARRFPACRHRKKRVCPQFDASAWNGLFAPKDAPKPVIDRLADALANALDDENVRNRLIQLGCEIPDRSKRGPQALGALVTSEIARWTPIIKAASIKVE